MRTLTNQNNMRRNRGRRTEGQPRPSASGFAIECHCYTVKAPYSEGFVRIIPDCWTRHPQAFQVELCEPDKVLHNP